MNNVTNSIHFKMQSIKNTSGHESRLKARQLAGIDFQKTGGNENPYAKGSGPHIEYNIKFEALTRQWADVIGSSA